MLKMRKTEINNKKGYILRLRQSRTFKGISMTLALSLIFEMIQPSVSMALTEGPSQPEVQSFEPIGTTQMVDLFTGDFNYNIPLFNLPGPNGGYPVNIAYHAGVSMDDEASWVGLGWNLNVGALVRNMRGLPDEFLSEYTDKDEVLPIALSNGNKEYSDYIETKTDMKESWTLGVNYGLMLEIFGGDVIGDQDQFTASIRYNNYRGLGASLGASSYIGYTSPFNIGLSLDSDNGLGVTAKLGLGRSHAHNNYDFNLSLSFDGNVSLNYGIGLNVDGSKDENGRQKGRQKGSIGSSLSFARSNFTPSIGNKVNNYNIAGSLAWGTAAPPVTMVGNSFGISFSMQDFANEDKKGKKRPVVGYAKFGSASSSEYFTQDFVRLNDGQITPESAILPVSYYSNDAYSSTGQGINGYFKGNRTDVGRVHDPMMRNFTFGGAADFEIASAVVSSHFGVGGSVNMGWDTQGAWDNRNDMKLNFNDPISGGIEENHYYQVHGEQTILHSNEYDYVNGTSLALIQFDEKDPALKGKRKITGGPIASQRTPNVEDRVVRNTLIHSLKNKEVEHLGEFKVPYYSYSPSTDLSQAPSEDSQFRIRRAPVQGSTDQVNIGNHNAGFKVLNEDGTYYVYALPAYNTIETENLFSVETPTSQNDPWYHNSQFNVDVDEDTQANEVEYKKQGTHKSINKTTKSPYAHSYMLTSVQGADYVDVTNDGPTVDDLGYWVKFSYVKYGNHVKWRAPFHGANYSQGKTYTGQDDKGSYQYGEKEQWYMGRMETKSHIAIFEMSERNDMKEAAGEFVNATDQVKMGTQSGLKIDKIKIYERSSFEDPTNSNPTPLQVVHFEYDYSLCQGVLNNDGDAPINPAGNMLPNENPTDTPINAGGKLTLKRLYFTSLNSNRGELSPYEFDYTSVNIDPNYQNALKDGGTHDLVNPNYQQSAYDPWGGYRPYLAYTTQGYSNGTFNGGYQQHANFPYVAQTSQGWLQKWSSLYPDQEETQANKELTQQANDLIASTWSLREIRLPSGGKINIEYESDDYSHVQHKVANQMFKIVKVGSETNPNDRLYNDPSENGLYFDNQSSHDEDRRRIYFKLEEPLKVGLTQDNYADSIYDKYVEPIMKDESGKRNLYFKSRMRLTNNSGNKVYEYIRGYLPLESQKVKNQGNETAYNYGVLTSSGNTGLTTTVQDGTEDYFTIGYVTIEPGQKKNGDFFDQYHPMALAAWTFMQTDAPELLNPSGSMSSVSTPNNTGEVLALFTSIFGVVPSTLSSFGAIRPYCKGKRFAQYIDLENSGIRLASPDRKKYGGGHRVKQISISDQWDTDTGGSEVGREYGQIYDYTTTDEKTGETISSGVAQYEPQAGGDENALKYPIYFYGKNKMFTNNNLFAEAPMNEALFPGAMVGYRKVTVRSLNTSDQMIKEAAEPSGSLGTARGRTGGITEHQFYTSKEFPTMVKWSELNPANNTKDVFNLPIPIPFIGSIKRNYYHGSQAFRIELNDMHGKPKSVKAYELNEYERNGSPITESIYEYQSTSISYQGETVKQLVNTVDVIPQSSGQDLTNTVSREMGLEVDLFTDQRESKSFWNSGGLDFNVDIASIIPFLSFWPSYSNHKTLFRTYVTNKVVHRTGILTKTKTRDLQTVNESEVLAYDEKAGTPLVSRVKNEFGESFYSYNIPAYYHYDRMGHAYRNINYSFNGTPSSLTNDTPDPTTGRSTAYMEVPASADMKKYLVRGDELLIVFEQTGSSNLYGKGYFLGWAYDGSTTLAKIQVLDYLNEGIESYNFKVIRSGRRNHYGSMAANYLTKGKLQFGDPALGQFANTGPGTNENQDLAELDNVLSATASLFKDDWGTTSSTDLSFDGITKNPFLSGNSGIWRPFKSYTYVGKRQGYHLGEDGIEDSGDELGSNTSDDPKLYDDGVMNGVPMFSWDLGNMEEYDLNWEWVNEVTRFSPDAYEVENVNRLGIYSSALYGYDNSLSIAVGGNASVHELGAFDFETSENGVSGLGKLLAQTNMNFDNNRTDNLSHVIMTEQYNILSAEMGANNVMTITTDVDASNFNAGNYVEGGKVGLTLRSRKTSTSTSSGQSWTNEGFYFNGDVTGTSVNGNNQIVFNVVPFIEKSVETLNLVEDGTKYVGKIALFMQRPFKESGFAPTSAECEYISGIAHTGDKSMLVKQISLFDQPQLKLIKGKEYVYSMWVRKTNSRVPTYEPGKHGNPSTSLVELGIMSGGSFDNSSSQITINKTTYSKIIEGWQKIDIEFKVNIDNAVLAVYFLRYEGDSFYVDDIRFSPKTGGITTYVYDPNRFWLRASLNVDNYATFFYYDEEGNLTLKEQETEEGIFTITESRGHVSEN